jgi:2-hydroxy-3-oxopropionate reductase
LSAAGGPARPEPDPHVSRAAINVFKRGEPHVSERIGFVGLGIMGRPMAAHLVDAGYAVTVWNRTRNKMTALVERGAAPGESPRDVAARSDITITMVADTPDVLDVILGTEGVIHGVRRGSIVADMSTISPAATREIAQTLREHGAEMLDAPVSGGEKGAIDAALSIMVGGKPEVFERVLPVFQKMGKAIVHLGEIGAGQVTKACNQLVLSLTLLGVAEAMTLARKSGVDPAKVRAALLGGFAQSRVLELHGQRMLDQNFEPGFRTRLYHKDMGIVMETGRSAGMPLVGGALAAQLYQVAMNQGLGEKDYSVLARVVAGLGGVET